MHPLAIRNPGLECQGITKHCILKADTNNPNPILSKLVQWVEMVSLVKKAAAFESDTLWNSFTWFTCSGSVSGYAAPPTGLQFIGSHN